MNDQQIPTPRTDSIPKNGAYHHWRIEDVFDLCRQLERELHQWRECAKKLSVCAMNERCTCRRYYDEADNLKFDPTNCRRCTALEQFNQLTK